MLTVATINLRHNADRWRERRHLLVAQLVDSVPDLVSLQEVFFPIGQGHWLCNQVNVRLTGKSNRPYRLIQRRKSHPIKGYFEGIGVLTRLPLLYTDSVSLGYEGRVALRVNVELPTRQVVDFVATHLHHVAHDKEARLEQVMMLTGWLNTHRRIPWQIVAGDFNELPDGPAVRRMKEGFRSAYEEKNGRDPLATFPTALVTAEDGWAGCLDYIFLSPGVGSVRSAKIFCDKPAAHDETLYPSDHVGLIAEIEG